VTEYGVAELYGKTIRQRAQALISVAHPDFREELTRKAKELNYI
jgi:acetyl-CoA hydrolase